MRDQNIKINSNHLPQIQLNDKKIMFGGGLGIPILHICYHELIKGKKDTNTLSYLLLMSLSGKYRHQEKPKVYPYQCRGCPIEGTWDLCIGGHLPAKYPQLPVVLIG